ncbi:MAG: helix-turn-helix transcriptional regulator [Verrucomicrobiota bacterium]
MSSDFDKVFGQNVYRLRNEAKLTQEQLAEKADMSRRFLQEIEAGQKTPSILIAARIREALHCDWEELMKNI